MFSAVYFPLVATLATPAPPSRVAPLARFASALLDGQINAAFQASCRLKDGPELDDHRYCLQLCADLQLVLGEEVEAEGCYRRLHRLMRASKQEIRQTSCRNAAWQEFFRHRLGTALSCFTRTVAEPGVAPVRVAEAQFGIVCVLYEMGRLQDAAQALELLEECVRADMGEGAALWSELLLALRLDIAVLTGIRSATALNDHVFWQSSGAALNGDEEVERRLREAQQQLRAPVLRARVRYLAQLRQLAAGQRDAVDALREHLQWAREQRLTVYQRTLRLEIAMATIAGSLPQLAESILEPLHQAARPGMGGYKHLEYLYCAAKSRQAQGRQQESLQLYSRYALIAMQCLREDAQVRAPVPARTAKKAPKLDDISVRLPARYRRAYSYMIENIARSDLSVREVATQIGVTERALQSAFKNYLGLSPTELIRRHRMEGIREELAGSDYPNDLGVLYAANKWGVQNRSTLVNGYRKQFDEVPSATLER